MSGLPHLLHALGVSRATVMPPQLQYQAGMRWPHHSWREMHQSRMLVIQCMYVFVHSSGTKRVFGGSPPGPGSTAAAAFCASGPALTHHWSISIGSITAPERWLRLRGTLYGLVARRK